MLVLYEKLILVRNAFFFTIVKKKVNNNNIKIRMVSPLT
tara:strand:- start:1135 stop:1251 length:117 start_codon:yes stop_codon:yes gene_type:complete